MVIEDPYPEHTRMMKITDESQVIGEFLESISPRGMDLCSWDEGCGGYLRNPQTTEQLLANYFGIDLVKIEEEKRDMLEKMRNG